MGRCRGTLTTHQASSMWTRLIDPSILNVIAHVTRVSAIVQLVTRMGSPLKSMPSCFRQEPPACFINTRRAL